MEIKGRITYVNIMLKQSILVGLGSFNLCKVEMCCTVWSISKIVQLTYSRWTDFMVSTSVLLMVHSVTIIYKPIQIIYLLFNVYGWSLVGCVILSPYINSYSVNYILLLVIYIFLFFVFFFKFRLVYHYKTMCPTL